MFLFLQERRVQTIFLLSFFAIMICLRAPNVFLYGRFWAEEGTVFFYNAWTMPPLQALFNSYGGYLNLSTNAITLIARWCFPLEYAPYFTTITGLFFQLLPLFLILTAKDLWLSSFKTRLVITLLLLFVPESAEISLQSLHIQFSLLLSSSIILILEPTYSYQRKLRLIILLLTGLSGLLSITLIPLYITRYYLQKNKIYLEQLLILIITNILQFSCFYTKFADRQYHISIRDFLSVFFIRDLYVPFLGNNDFSTPYVHYVQHIRKLGETPIFAEIITISVIMIVLFYYYKYPKIRLSGYLFIYALINIVTSIIGSIGLSYYLFEPYICQRYFFVSQSLLCLTLVYFACNLPAKGKIICKMIITWMICINMYNFCTNPYAFNQHIISWPDQIYLWKKNNNYLLQVWPKEWPKMKPIIFNTTK